MYYKPSTGQVFANHSAIRSDMTPPIVLYPPAIDDDMLAYVGIYPLTSTPPAVAGSETAEPTTIEEIDGAWVQQWNVRPATQEELDARVPPAEPVPSECAMWQARAILIEDDMLDEVIAALNSITDEKARKIALAKLEYSSTVRRNDPLVTEIIPTLGKSEAEIDEMFRRAVRLA